MGSGFIFQGLRDLDSLGVTRGSHARLHVATQVATHVATRKLLNARTRADGRKVEIQARNRRPERLTRPWIVDLGVRGLEVGVRG
jgi:hypothetical protein